MVFHIKKEDANTGNIYNRNLTTMTEHQTERKQSPYKDRNGEIIHEGDTVKGIGSHVGQSEVFFDANRWQPFTFLNDYDGNNYEIVKPSQQT